MASGAQIWPQVHGSSIKAADLASGPQIKYGLKAKSLASGGQILLRAHRAGLKDTGLASGTWILSQGQFWLQIWPQGQRFGLRAANLASRSADLG